MLAFQIGQDVSFSEPAASLHVNARTVRRYLELLEKTFVIFSLNGFSRNLRKEYTKSPRYYFWDNGIRNALISNFNPIHLRDDVGRAKPRPPKDFLTTCNGSGWRVIDQENYIDFITVPYAKNKGPNFHRLLSPLPVFTG